MKNAGDGGTGSRRRFRGVCAFCGVNKVELLRPSKAPMCLACNVARKLKLCHGCGKSIDADTDHDSVIISGKPWHLSCAAAFGYTNDRPVESTADAKSAPAMNAAGQKFLVPDATDEDLMYGMMTCSEYSLQSLESAADSAVFSHAIKQARASHKLPADPSTTDPIATALALERTILRDPLLRLPHDYAFSYDEDYPPSKPFISYSLEGIAQRIQVMGLLRERTKGFKTFRNVFIGKEFVDYLLSVRQCASRTEAVTIGRLMIHYGMIAGPTGERIDTFEDKDSSMYSIVPRRRKGLFNEEHTETAAAPASRPLQPPNTPVGTSSMVAGTPKRSLFGSAFKRSATAPMPVSVEDHTPATSLGSDAASRDKSDIIMDSLRSWDGKGDAALGVTADEGSASLVQMAFSEPTTTTTTKRRSGAIMPRVEEADDSLYSDASPRTPAAPSTHHQHNKSSFGFVETSSESPAAGKSKPPGGSKTPTPVAKAGAVTSLSDAVAEARRKLALKREELESRHVHEGWMVKRGHRFKTWKRRYFVLVGFELAYYRKGPQGALGFAGVAPAKQIDLRDYALEEATIAKSPLAMRLVSKVSDAQYLVHCENENDFVAWVKAITSTMRDFDELGKQWMELHGAPVRMTESGSGAVTFSILGGK